jgi:hypothetical protein
MQPPITNARSQFTEAQITKLIKRDPILVGAGMDLLDRDLNVLSSLSNNLVGGEVKRSNYATLHGSCSFGLTTQLAWGSAIVRPYMLMTNGTITARFNLGAYFTNTPDNVTGEDPTTYSVEGYDILDALNQEVGDGYAVNAGVEYLAAIETILINQGYSQYSIDTSRAGTLLPSAKGWAMSEKATWLRIVNELLAAIGYRGIYSDWDGRLICAPYTAPEERQAEWTYDDGEFTSELGPQQVIKHDFYRAPNRWVGVINNAQEGETPTEGAGMFTYQNDSDGETSVEARGRVIQAPRIEVDAADQAALVTAVMQQVARDKVIDTMIEANTTPNPLHWHFDILKLTTAELGTLKLRENEWSLPLDGGQMTHIWAVV